MRFKGKGALVINNELLKDFVQLQIYDHLFQMLKEYRTGMHPVLKQMSSTNKEMYENIFLKTRDEVPLDESEAFQLYQILKDVYQENEESGELCFQACAWFCYTQAKDHIIENELKNNYYAHTRG